MSKLKIVKLVVCLSAILISSIVRAQTIEVSASVDKNPVMADESFILSLVANGDVERSAFDSSALLGDFVVGRTSVSSQTQMINFDTTKTTTWSTILIPRKEGRFTIPAFDVAGAITRPIDILVVPVSSSSAAKGRDLFVTTSVDVNQAYLQQQIHYTVKLHLGKDLQRGSLSSPTLENADIRQIGKDKEYNEIVDGRRYRIIERSFAIIPQQSGTFTIEGPLFEGEVADNARQSFGFFNRSKAINRVGQNQSITVLPIPTNYTEHWLPSEFVQLDDEWQGAANGFVAGEPITRTLTLTAIGVVEEQLPQITSDYPSSVKTYPDQAETTTVEKDNTLIAQRKQNIAIIPSQAGSLIIPEVRVPWFNTITQKTEWAVLPEKTIQILPAITQPENTIPDTPAVTQQSTFNQNVAPTQQPNLASGISQYWSWLAISLLILWLTTLGMWWLHVKRLTTQNAKHQGSIDSNTLSESAIWKNLENSLNKNNSKEIQSNLALWLAAYTQESGSSLNKSLDKINNQLLSHEVNTLLASLYSDSKGSWQSDKLHKILRQIRKDSYQQLKSKQHLALLYPTD